MIWFLISLITITSTVFYLYVQHKQRLWQRLGIPGPKPIFLLGTDHELGRQSWPKLTLERYRQYGKIFGSFQLLTPILTIHEPELIQQVFIKDFRNYANRMELRTYHKYFNENLFFTDIDKWKRMRAIISPSFTTGKIRSTIPMMNQCIDQLFEHFERNIQQSNGHLNVRKFIMGLTMDVIAATGFSTAINSNDSTNVQDSFVEMGMALFRQNIFQTILAITLPKFLLRLLRIRLFFNEKPYNYFCNLVIRLIQQRKHDNDQKSADILQLILDAEVDDDVINDDNLDNLIITMNNESNQQSIINENKEKTKNLRSTLAKGKLTETEVIANSVLLLIAGFETTSSIIVHCLFEMAWNPTIQQRCYEELQAKLDGLDYNSHEYFDIIMHKLPYFESIIKETLRKYPPCSIIPRSVSVDHCQLNGIPLQKNTIIHLPTHAVHHCEDYYPEPEKFLPERFMPENRHNLVPYTYFPFGLGPRNCVGMRFAYQELHYCLSRLLLNYHFETLPETPSMLTFVKGTPIMQSLPFDLRITKRC
ncbi:lithocholate 6-beta-hydroxylase-like [Dermatophagoides farinae]|uniref:Lithocholate 6-beta-hydroxylase-like n=1 Tax=Dermatophagoides farinae TaxID=6954 RepID=A0A9D4NVM8_DERFA|nr:cytochrome P450 3A9-like [Dermatophagoides farinae]KAH7639539.1 lithocholate 6-beta-hydroxylase-like [Dermatophagoides farinae]